MTESITIKGAEAQGVRWRCGRICELYGDMESGEPEYIVREETNDLIQELGWEVLRAIVGQESLDRIETTRRSLTPVPRYDNETVRFCRKCNCATVFAKEGARQRCLVCRTVVQYIQSKRVEAKA